MIFYQGKREKYLKVAKNDNNHKNIIQRFFFTRTDWKKHVTLNCTVKRLEAKTYQTIETCITIYVRDRFAPIRYWSSLELEISVVIHQSRVRFEV